ncbi:MAG: hypothetical protein MI924_27810 [Chloroflexales bacterium]|nr:hypothetical protein [Chloroflexales bacterium]
MTITWPFPFSPFDIIPFMLPLIIAYNINAWRERRSFSRFEGKLQRGVPVGRSLLSLEQEQWVRVLSTSVREGAWFLRVEPALCLLGREQPRSKFWSIYLPHIAIIDLRQPRLALQYRMTLTNVVDTMMVGLSLFSLAWFVTTQNTSQLPFGEIFLIGGLIYTFLFWIYFFVHSYRERRRLQRGLQSLLQITMR